MAEVARLPRVATQLALAAELRWRLFCNSLRAWKGRLELFALVFLLLLAGTGAAGVGVALGAGARASLAGAGAESLAGLLWAVFACWQVAPVVLAGFAVEFEFHRLLIFPLRFPAFALLSLSYGVFDPPSVVALFWTACVATGILIARPVILPWAIVVLTLFSAANLLLNRLFLSWLQQLLARRRAREAFAAVVLLGMVSVQLCAALAERWEEQGKPGWKAVESVLRVLPPEAASAALTGAARRNPHDEAAGTALLAAYALGFGLLLRRRLLRQYRGDDVGEETPPPAARKKMLREGWRMPGLSGPAAAMCEKELRYAARNGQTWLSLVLPPLLVLFFAIVWNQPDQRPVFLARAPGLFFPLAAAYSFLLLAPLLHNSFAFEGHGIQLLLVVPARFQDILLAKNLVQGLLIFFGAGFTGALASLLLAAPRWEIVVVTLSALLFATLAHFLVGNALSLCFPRQIEFGQFRRRAPVVSVLLGMAAQVAVMAAVGVVLFETRLAGPVRGAWIATTIFLGLSAVTLRGYIRSLDWGARIARERGEVLTAELCR